MLLDSTAACEYLNTFEIKELFIEELGWDRFQGTLGVQVGQNDFVLTGIAHKRGIQIYLCADNPNGFVPNVTIRRIIQCEVMRYAHHNVIIFLDAMNSASIWQWAEWHLKERTQRVYEHIVTKSDAFTFVNRLMPIAFTLEDEETLTIIDVADRMRNTFCDNQHRLLRGQHKRAGLRAYDLKEMDSGIRFWWERVLSEPYLTKKEEYRVARSMCRGDERATDLLIQSHLHLVARLAWRVAKKYQCSLDDYFDLVQMGNAELVRITPGFNPDDGVRFQTYVTYRVKKLLLRSLSGEDGFISLPRYILESLPDIVQQRQITEDKLMQICNRPIPEDMVIKHLVMQYGVDEQTTSRVLVALDGVVPLLEDEEEDTQPPFPEALELAASLLSRETVAELLSVLKPRQCDVIQRRFGLAPYQEQTLEEIATCYGVTRERVRQIELKALKKLKQHYT